MREKEANWWRKVHFFSSGSYILTIFSNHASFKGNFSSKVMKKIKNEKFWYISVELSPIDQNAVLPDISNRLYFCNYKSES